MRVLFLPLGNRTRASSRLRAYQYLEPLRRYNIEGRVLWLGGLKAPLPGLRRLHWRARLLWEATQADVVLVQKLLLRDRNWHFLRMCNRRIIYDFDDAIYTSPPWKDRPPDQVRQSKGRLDYILSHSQHVIVSGDYLANYARQLSPQVSIIPTPVDTERFVPWRTWEHDSDKVVIGWVGLKDNLFYLERIAEVLSLLVARFRDRLVFKVVSDGILEIPGIQVWNESWNLEREAANLQDFDIGIMPLRQANDPWTLGKIGTKAMQYMALAVPTVASPTPFTESLIVDGENGFLADSDDEWFEKLAMLIEDANLRRRVGSAGREKIEREYSLQVCTRLLATVIDHVARST